MPRKSQRRQADETQLLAWYKWEFLRRNTEYRNDYDNFVNQFGAWFQKHGHLYESTYWSPDVWKQYGRVIAPRAQKLCEKWQVIDLLPPDWKFDDSGIYEYSRVGHVLLPTGYAAEEIRELWKNTRHHSQLTLKAFEKNLPTDTSLIRVDRIRYYNLRLDFAQPLRRLLAGARQEITQRKRRYDRSHPVPPRVAHTKRLRLDRYETYLQVWDLRVQGKTFYEIGAELFPHQRGSAQRARDNYQASKRLILGGYTEIG